MKHIIKLSSLILFSSILLFSCRSEETQFVQEEPNQILGANANVKTLIQNTVTNDGSYDNILDGASCFDIQLPVTVIANGIEVIITNEDDVDQVEVIFDEFPDDVDTLEINFPITIIHEDYSTTVINSQAELNAAALQCGDENSPDDDIECIDFQYPITANIFNQNNEQIDTVVFNSDEELFDFVDDIDEDLIIVFQFPITVILSDGSTQTVNDFEELENVIEEAADDCDEDDDNDPDDDDCEDCTVEDLEDFILGCDEWMVDKLERNDEDLEDLYVGYAFTFNDDGTVDVDNGTDNFSGTWEASESGGNIIFDLNLPDLTDFNDAWVLHEVQIIGGEYKFDLRLGDDRLRFESDCNDVGDGPDDSDLVAALTTGDWYITYFFDDTDETSDFEDYVFNFNEDGTGQADNGSQVTDGIWDTAEGDETELELSLNFGIQTPLDELAEDWDVLEVTMDIIRLKDISGGDGSEDFLTFERDPSGGGGDGDLSDILSEGTWEVALYTDDGSDETGDYAGYDITFNTDGSVIADNGSNTNNGSWEALNSDNTLLLDFGADFPFDEFNDDWDVISVSETMVELQDVSGGGGGTDVLIFEKQ